MARDILYIVHPAYQYSALKRAKTGTGRHTGTGRGIFSPHPFRPPYRAETETFIVMERM